MARRAKALTRKPEDPRLIPGTEVKVEGQTTSTKLSSHLHTCPTLKNKNLKNLKLQTNNKKDRFDYFENPCITNKALKVGNLQNDGEQKKKKLKSNFLFFSNM